MPQPFEHLTMQSLQNMSANDMFKKLDHTVMTPSEINNTMKIANLAHFLVNNYRDELSSGEHVVDTAIRLLNKK